MHAVQAPLHGKQRLEVTSPYVPLAHVDTQLVPYKKVNPVQEIQSFGPVLQV